MYVMLNILQNLKVFVPGGPWRESKRCGFYTTYCYVMFYVSDMFQMLCVFVYVRYYSTVSILVYCCFYMFRVDIPAHCWNLWNRHHWRGMAYTTY